MSSPLTPGPPYPSGTPSAVPARGPSNKGYVIGGILLGVGVVVGIVLVIVGVLAVASINPSDFPRTRANHSLKIDFEHAGGYVAYYESPSVGDSIDSDVDVPNFSLTITDPSGHRVSTSSYVSTLTYSREGHHGIAAKTFHIDEAGVYTVKVGSLPGGSDARVAFGKSTAGTTVGGVILILAGIFGGGLLALIGLIVLVVTFIRRRRFRNDHPTGGPTSGYPPPAYPTPGQTPPATPGWAAPQAPGQASPGAPAPPAPPPSRWQEPPPPPFPGTPQA